MRSSLARVIAFYCAALAVPSLLLSSATPSPDAEAQPSPPKRVVPAPDKAAMDDPTLSTSAQQILAYCRQRFPDHFGGLVLAPGAGQIIIYRRPSTAMDAALRRQFPSVQLVARAARYSERDLNYLLQRLLADWDSGYWRGRGVEIRGVAQQPDAGGFEVAVPNAEDVARARQLLTQRYGANFTVVVHGQVKPLDQP